MDRRHVLTLVGILCLLLFLLSPLNATAASVDSATMHLKLDSASGMTQDEHGAFSAYVYGPEWTEKGKVNGALTFDGTDDWVKYEDEEKFCPPSLTLGFWIKPEALKTCGLVIMRPDTTSNSCNWQSVMLNTGALRFSWYNEGDWHIVDTDETPLQTGKWSFITHSYSSGTVKTYVNGELLKESSGNAPLNTTPQGRVALGVGSAGFFHGLMDEVILFNSALSDDEVKTLYDEIGGKTESEYEDPTMFTDPLSGPSILCWIAVLIMTPAILASIVIVVRATTGQIDLKEFTGGKTMQFYGGFAMLVVVLFIFAVVAHPMWAPVFLQPLLDYIYITAGSVFVFILAVLAIGGMYVRALDSGWSPSKVGPMKAGPARDGVGRTVMVDPNEALGETAFRERNK